MNQLPSASLVILQNTLFKFCDEGESGTVLISTLNNKSCQISLKDGQITAIALGRLKSSEAVLELDNLGCVKASLKRNIDLPLGDEAAIDSSMMVLKCLGYVDSSRIQTELDQNTDRENSILTESPTTKKESSHTYRGQQIIKVAKPPESESTVTDQTNKPSNIPKKKVRMYRGQVIED